MMRASSGMKRPLFTGHLVCPAEEVRFILKSSLFNQKAALMAPLYFFSMKSLDSWLVRASISF